MEFGRVNGTWYSPIATWCLVFLFCELFTNHEFYVIGLFFFLRVSSRLENAHYHVKYHVDDLFTDFLFLY